MSTRFIMRCLFLTAWGLVLCGTLSITKLPGDWGYAVCGIWGCGPTLQTLVACHLSWFVVLVPASILFMRWGSRATLIRAGLIGLSLALFVAVTITLHEHFFWAQQASELQRQYFWKRVGFVIVTSVEIPLVEFFCVSLGVLLWEKLFVKSELQQEK